MQEKTETKINFFIRLPKALWINVIDFLVERRWIDQIQRNRFQTNAFVWKSLNLVTKSFDVSCYAYLFTFDICLDEHGYNRFHQFCLNQYHFRWSAYGLLLAGSRRFKGMYLPLGRCCFRNLTNMKNLRLLYLECAYTDDYSCLTQLYHITLDLKYFYDPLVLPETILSVTLRLDSRLLLPKQTINIPSKCKKLIYLDAGRSEENTEANSKLVLNGELLCLQTNVVPDLTKVPNLEVLLLYCVVSFHLRRLVCVQELQNLTSCLSLKELGISRNCIRQFENINAMFFTTIEILHLDEVCVADCEWLKRFVNLKTLRCLKMVRTNKLARYLFALPNLMHIYWQNETS